MKSIMDILKQEAQEAFLKRSPLERIETMHGIMMEIINLKAKGEGVTEHEVYKKYLANNPRHYQRPA